MPAIKERPVVILVEPQLGENIGMAARAMANFGLTHMRLVNPRDGWPNERAVSAASRANHIIDEVQVFATLEEAISDLHHVYATTARGRDMLLPVIGPQECSEKIVSDARDGDLRSGILFGRERWGLINEEVALANAIVTLPVDPDFASLNIAQAVLILSYEWRAAALNRVHLPVKDYTDAMVPAAKEDQNRLMVHMEAALERANYFRPAEKRDRLAQNLRSMMQKTGWSAQEVRSFRGVIKALENGPGRRDRQQQVMDNGNSNDED